MMNIQTCPTESLNAASYDMIREEIHRATADALDRMDDRTKIICRSRNRLLARQSAEMNRRSNRRRGPLRRFWGHLVDAYAMAWAMVVCYGEALGLIERED